MGTRAKNVLLVVSLSVSAILVAAVGVLAWNYNLAKKDAATKAQSESSRVIKEVGHLYLLPTDEQPTVARVQDRSKLDSQPFFAQAQNGDYLVVYSKNKLALIFREHDSKLVNVGPISPAAGPSTGQTQPKTVTAGH